MLIVFNFDLFIFKISDVIIDGHIFFGEDNTLKYFESTAVDNCEDIMMNEWSNVEN
jgi:hypothetical protein